MLFVAFDFTSWYAFLAYAAAAYLLWRAFFGQLVTDARAVWRKLRPDPEPPPTTEATERSEPYVVIGHPGGHQSVTPLNELAEGEKSRLTRVEPRYLIENKDPAVGIRDVTTGVRTRDGQEHRFDSFFAGLIGPGAPAQVENVGSIPDHFLVGVHESAAFSAFVYWARFSREGVRWEVVYDPQTRQNRYGELPSSQPQLELRVRKTGTAQHVLDITNTGDVLVEQVEVDLPPNVTNWQVLTEAFATYPIRVLAPGDTQTFPVAVAMGGPASVEAVVRGNVDGVPYERDRTISIIG